MKIKKKDMIYLKAGILAAVTVICFISVYLWDNSREIKTNENGEQILERSENGEDQTHKMKVRIGEKESDMDISVSGRMYNSKELNIAFQTASEELETLILGENKSLDEVRSNLDLITAIPDTDISVSWQTDRYDVIDMQGNLQKDSMEEEGTVVKLTAVLSYADEKAAHEFYVKVYPPLQNDDERIMEDLQTSIVRSDEKTATEEYMVLPDSVNGEKIQWKYGTDQRAAAILVIGIGAAGMLIISEGQRKKEEEKKNSRQIWRAMKNTGSSTAIRGNSHSPGSARNLPRIPGNAQRHSPAASAGRCHCQEKGNRPAMALTRVSTATAVRHSPSYHRRCCLMAYICR